MGSSSLSTASAEKEIAANGEVEKEEVEEEEGEEKPIYVNVCFLEHSTCAKDFTGKGSNHWYVIRPSRKASKISRVFQNKLPCTETALTGSNCVVVGSSTLYLIGGFESYKYIIHREIRCLDAKSSDDDSVGWEVFSSLPFPCYNALTAASGCWVYVILGQREEVFQISDPWGYAFHADNDFKAFPLDAPPGVSSKYAGAVVGIKGGILVYVPADDCLVFYNSSTRNWSTYHMGDVNDHEYPDAYVVSDDVLYFYKVAEVPRLSAFDICQRKRLRPVHDLPTLCYTEHPVVQLVSVAKDKLCLLRQHPSEDFSSLAVCYSKLSVSRDSSSLHVVVEEQNDFEINAEAMINCVAL